MTVLPVYETGAVAGFTTRGGLLFISIVSLQVFLQLSDSREPQAFEPASNPLHA